ncbi:cutinase family protein [Euzebya sp.]|uniref:cutinase family protein n=1 Tax=Euzebya sp. TaxID=1971409 RepID=UPI0035113935
MASVRPAAAVLAALTLLATQPGLVGAQTAAGTARCADVIVVAARGSAQAAGPGPELEAVATQLAHRVEGEVQAVGVVYDASPFGGALLDPVQFRDAVRLGGARMLKQSVAAARRCPSSALVWAGFSQGAAVVRAAMRRADSSRRDPPAVAAVVLLADPSTVLGSAADLPDGWADRTAATCLDGDPVCDLDGGDVVRGLMTHLRGYRDPEVLAPLTLRVADLLAVAPTG